MKRKAPKFYGFEDHEFGLGIVRYDGNPDTWERLVRDALDLHGFDAAMYDRVAEPKLRWLRMNVCSPNDPFGWAWQLGYANGPGPGNFFGAEVRWRHDAR